MLECVNLSPICRIVGLQSTQGLDPPKVRRETDLPGAGATPAEPAHSRQ